MTAEQARREVALLEAELARRSLLNFTCYTKRDYAPNWHHRVLASALDQVLDGTVRYVMVFMPPQNGKSELISRKFPGYVLGRQPSTRIIVGSYGLDWARSLTLDAQKVMAGEEYRRLFPHVRLAEAGDLERRAAGDMDIVGGTGGLKAAGVGVGISGRPMTLGVIDDPHKNREEAESEVMRAKVIKWFNDDFMSRRSHEHVPIVLTQTRWHEGDLAGHLLDQARNDPRARQWAVVSLPAVCERQQPYDPRQIGEALWPARFSLDELRKTEAADAYSWASLYQQRPAPSGGSVMRREWFRRYEVLAPGNVLRRCRCWDLAATIPSKENRDPDWTVGTLVAELVGGLWMVEHVVRMRGTPDQVDNLIYQTAVADGRRVLVRELREGGSSGKAIIAAHTRMLAGWDFDEWTVWKTAKVEQWRPFARQVEAGNVVLPQGDVPWLRQWLDEVTLVPHALHDDQADSVAGAFNALTQHVPKKKGAAAVLPAGATVRPAVQPGVIGRSTGDDFPWLDAMQNREWTTSTTMVSRPRAFDAGVNKERFYAGVLAEMLGVDWADVEFRIEPEPANRMVRYTATVSRTLLASGVMSELALQMHRGAQEAEMNMVRELARQLQHEAGRPRLDPLPQQDQPKAPEVPMTGRRALDLRERE